MVILVFPCILIPLWAYKVSLVIRHKSQICNREKVRFAKETECDLRRLFPRGRGNDKKMDLRDL